MNKTEIEHVLKNDILLIAYFMNENDWTGASKSSFQRVLYFAAALSPIFIPHEDWAYNFSNTYFGPYNNEISSLLGDLTLRDFLVLEQRAVYTNRTEERYKISDQGIQLCKNTLFELEPLKKKISWFKILFKVLSIYGEDFLSKLIKEDPNVYYQNKVNKNVKINTTSSPENFSSEFFKFIKDKGKNELNIDLENDQDYLLLFFDTLYRKYKGGKA